MALSSFAISQINFCTRSVEILCVFVCNVSETVCVSLYECECVFMCVCGQSNNGRDENCNFSSKKLKINEINTILKTHKYKQHKEFIVMCISKHIVHVEKVKMWIFSKIYNLKNIVHNYIISSLCVALVQMHNWVKYKGSKL